MEKIVSLCKRRGFIFPGSEIYGGLANSWDYGPLGVELKNNIKQEWWKRFVHQRTDVVGIDSALIMNPKVWEASGHLSNFSDPLVECPKDHQRFRADQIEITDNGFQLCPSCGEILGPEKQFNLMFKTFIGPSEEQANIAYFRPETAQGMFVDFKNVLETTRKRLPFGIAQIGKSFRNEITPGNFIFRTREFEQMEIEYFIAEKDWKAYFEHWLDEMKRWLKDLGIAEEKLHYDDIPEGERAHYSQRTVDIEYDFPFGKKELYGLAYRTDFDLKNHMEKSGEDLRYTDPESGEEFLPHVIEPTWGVDRSVLAALVEAYHEEEAPTAEKGETEARVVLKFPKWLAPVKVAILPLSKKENLSSFAKEIHRDLVQEFVCEYDETQSIGKRYRRQDEIGTPYCVTVDFESLEDKAVTVRDRDTMQQERIAIAELKAYLREKLS
ncbi:MAG: glycine--tRNA ligase [Patescibacteria group bacterium]|nr:glycine--tRNA ligase [Patescibacteria group bacterium]